MNGDDDNEDDVKYLWYWESVCRECLMEIEDADES